MKTSTDRILITRVGSLPRPDDLVTSCDYRIGKKTWTAPSWIRISEVIDDLVALQVENGVDVVNDGEAARCLITYMPSTD